jgi:hypothetical protein
LISALTLKNDSSNRIVYLDNTDSTLFDRVKFVGNYTNLNTTPTSSQNGIESRGTSNTFLSYNVLFNYCIFNNIGYGFYSNSDHDNISFDHCVFYQLYDAINIGGGVKGALNTNITNCYFDHVVRYGIYVKKGYGNISSHNRFMSVGNNNQNSGSSAYPIIKFDTDNNQSISDYFQRNSDLRNQDGDFPNRVFTPNIQSSGVIYDNTSFIKNFDVTLGPAVVLLRFPLTNSGKYIIDYVLKKTTSGIALRTGTMTVIVDATNALSTIVDDFNYTGSSTVELIKFSVGLHSYRTGDTIPPTIPLDTMTINIYNPVGNGIGTINYTYRIVTQ